MADVKTFILRFRDLNIETGETIHLHQELCVEHGAVFWGWWNKGGEKTPANIFSKLLSQCRSEGLKIYLLDSAQHKLYQATCHDILWDHGGERIALPGGGNAPNYYNESNFYVWFKISDITEVRNTEEELKTFAYCYETDLFEGGISQYEAFNNKRIFSAEELIQQNVTIWFVRLANDQDSDRQILLSAPAFIRNEDFQSEFSATHQKSILWFSDTHFDEKGEKHAFPSENNATNKTLEVSVSRKLDKDGTTKDIAALVISGDLTFKAKKVEFERAKEFVQNTKSLFSVSEERVVICPGNHDTLFEESVENGPISETVSEEAKQNYSQFYEDVTFSASNEFLCSGRRIILGNRYPIEIVGINSTHLQQHQKTFQGHGFISDDQMNYIADQMNWASPDSEKSVPFRIAVLHHHVLPIHYSITPEQNARTSVVFDGGALMEWLVMHKVKLVLHGHMHKPYMGKVALPISDDKWHEVYIASLGSSGIIAADLLDHKQNTFGMISVQNNTVKVSMYDIASNALSDRNGPIKSMEIPYE
jgi:predicted MPP superfamily phosphohydrolase